MSAAELAQLAARVLATPPAASRVPPVGNFGDDMFSNMMQEVSRDAGPWGALVSIPASLAKGAIDSATHHDPHAEEKKRAAAAQKKQAEEQKRHEAEAQKKRAAEQKKREADQAKRQAAAEARQREEQQKREAEEAKRRAEEAKRHQDQQRLVYAGIGVGGFVVVATVAAIVRRR